MIRALLIAAAALMLVLLVGVPLVVVFVEAFAAGPRLWLAALATPESRHAIGLTLLTAALVVPANTVFGIAAAWCLGHYRFRGRALLVTLIDLPTSVSPVVAGMLFVLLFGRTGLLGPWLAGLGVHILFTPVAIVLATAFVTFPYVAREVLPLVESQGQAEEEAALTLGASLWRILRSVTLPKIRWGLLYGVVLCNARAMGEFGAVSVVSGHIRGATDTIPLHIEILYQEYDVPAAFALASLLTLIALALLVAKKLVERSEPGRGRGSAMARPVARSAARPTPPAGRP
jgi:sulfate/thiosulfate transport system permease protein